MAGNQYKEYKLPKQKEFKANYDYIEPVFEPKKIPGINEVTISGRIGIDNG